MLEETHGSLRCQEKKKGRELANDHINASLIGNMLVRFFNSIVGFWIGSSLFDDELCLIYNERQKQHGFPK